LIATFLLKKKQVLTHSSAGTQIVIRFAMFFSFFLQFANADQAIINNESLTWQCKNKTSLGVAVKSKSECKKLGEKVLQNYFCFKDQPKEATLCQAESQTPESCKDGVSLKVWQCTLSPKITRCFMPSGYERCPKSHRFISLGPGSPEGRIFGSLFRDGICAKIGD
jgi:hypothetical protein